MTDFELIKKKSGADVVVDDNTAATFTKDHQAKPGQPFLAPPGAKASVAEAEAIANNEWRV